MIILVTQFSILAVMVLVVVIRGIVIRRRESKLFWKAVEQRIEYHNQRYLIALESAFKAMIESEEFKAYLKTLKK